jgi:hypothetical protein
MRNLAKLAVAEDSCVGGRAHPPNSVISGIGSSTGQTRSGWPTISASAQQRRTSQTAFVVSMRTRGSTVLFDKFRAMVTGELKAQITEIDKQSRDLGIEPDPFEASAPAPKAKKSE